MDAFKLNLSSMRISSSPQSVAHVRWVGGGVTGFLTGSGLVRGDQMQDMFGRQ